jgi:plastocyanin domain-containing protein
MSPILVFMLAATVAGALVALWALRSRGFSKQAKLGPAGMQELDISVNGKYSPAVVVVKEGIPVLLNFTRNEDDACSEWVIFSEFNLRRRLPPYKTTPILLIPNKQGEFLFTCQFGMYTGKVIVQKSSRKRVKPAPSSGDAE